ncbi:DUF397 domain-containing protein [Longispora sp. NPDC051575]|uniref:DUF397 domain-containing protein n=1 Tax=Longispora sp. NPDC051575 TaxID=3154943 RepID=UPI003422B4E5
MIISNWRKSLRSDGGANCVEVGTGRGVVGVRDTKQRGRGPVLAFEARAWVSFVAAAKRGSFDR